jgi:polar amino acid transport system substrate-binding protein
MQLSRSSRARAQGRADRPIVAASLATALLLVLAAAPARGGTLDRLREGGALKIGYVADARPFSYRDESGRAAGYSIALCGKVVDALKAEVGRGDVAVEYVAVAPDDRIPAVKAGRVDLLCAEATVTLARRRDVSFSIPIFPSGVGALLRTDAPSRLREVLAGRAAPQRPLWRGSSVPALEQRNFTAVAGTTGESWLRERKDTLKIASEVAPSASYDAGIERVLTRESDVFFADRPILLDAAKRSPSADDLLVLDRLFTYEPLGLALARDDEDFRLLVDRTLSELYRSGEIGNLYTSYFGEPDESALTFFRLSALPE